MADKVAGLLFRISADTKALRQGMTSAQKQVTGMKSAVKNLGVAMGATFGASIVLRGVKNMVRITAEFEQSMADVKSITGATGDEFERLENLAKELGRSTKFTASEVAQLEKEYAKLGFTTSEIENAAKATLNLAAATGSDLAKAAEVAGGVIRAFRLDAEETIRVTDVMARSFSTTALDMEKFSEAMKYVAPIAKEAGLTVEETSALLGILANNMISGSMAGTSLRNILSELVGTGGSLQDRLKELSEKGLNLADAESEVGKRSQTALIVLTKQLDMLPHLTKEYENAAGAAEDMAKVQLETLEGALTILNSAWQGLIIEVGTSGDAMEDSQKVITGMSKGLNWLTENLDAVSKSLRVYLAALAPVYGQFVLFDALFGKENIPGARAAFNRTGITTGFIKPEEEEVVPSTPVAGRVSPSIDMALPTADLFMGSTEAIENLKIFFDILKDVQPMIQGVQELDAWTIKLQQSWVDMGPKLQEVWNEAGIGMGEWVSLMKEFSYDLTQTIRNLVRSVVADLSQIAEAWASGTPIYENAFSFILKQAGKFAQQMGALMMAYGLTVLKFYAAFANPFALIAAGAALMILGGAISGLAKSKMTTPKTGGGGAIHGSYGYSPSIEVSGVLRGSDIYLSNKNYTTQRGRM